jgi:hypothetical protein
VDSPLLGFFVESVETRREKRGRKSSHEDGYNKVHLIFAMPEHRIGHHKGNLEASKIDGYSTAALVHFSHEDERRPEEGMVVTSFPYLFSSKPQGLQFALAFFQVLEKALHKFHR